MFYKCINNKMKRSYSEVNESNAFTKVCLNEEDNSTLKYLKEDDNFTINYLSSNTDKTDIHTKLPLIESVKNNTILMRESNVVPNEDDYFNILCCLVPHNLNPFICATFDKNDQMIIINRLDPENKDPKAFTFIDEYQNITLVVNVNPHKINPIVFPKINGNIEK